MLRSVANIAATVTATQQQRAALLIGGGESPPADSKNSSNEQDNSTADNATVLADAMAKLEADRNKQSLDTDSARAKVYKEIAGTVDGTTVFAAHHNSTFTTIAQRFGLDPEVLLEINKQRKPDWPWPSNSKQCKAVDVKLARSTIFLTMVTVGIHHAGSLKSG